MTIEHTEWRQFLAAIKDGGGSLDTGVNGGGRYPSLEWPGWTEAQRASVVISAFVGSRLTGEGEVHLSPPRSWMAIEDVRTDYDALAAVGARFRDARPPGSEAAQ